MGIVFKQTFQYIDEGETSSSDFVTSVTHSITNICYCVQYVLYLIYTNEICSIIFIYLTYYL